MHEAQGEVMYQLDCTRWTYFCESSGWGDDEAMVVCRELGYTSGVSGEKCVCIERDNRVRGRGREKCVE